MHTGDVYVLGIALAQRQIIAAKLYFNGIAQRGALEQ